MYETLKKLARLWVHKVHPRLMSFVATAGVTWLGVCLLLLFGLTNLAEEVLEQETFAFDEIILLSVNQYANPVLDQVMLTATRLGDPAIVVPLTCIGVVWLWWYWRWRIAAIFAITCIGGAVLSTGFKLVFQKERPVLWSQLITETSYSFPSGHALGAMVLYGFLAYLLVQRFQSHKRLIYGIATLLIASIGFSRIYLGVHWPTDVVAGYSIGFLWLSVCIGLFQLEIRRSEK
ncbi:phosphatase PAP2 family protein [Leptolyngbya sp. AN02str]|uniref:phosphatase PAP2 family protein n=1 Tax=Leptolyngbya sp. AN02str TaxID=3423363 RepID=UPI003D32336B